MTRLPCHRCDAVEVGVIVQYGHPDGLGSGSDEKIGNLAAPLTPTGQQALNLARPVHVARGRLDQGEGVEGPLERIPLACVAGGVADL